MRLPRANKDLYDPIEMLDARYAEAGKDFRTAWESLSRDELAFVIREIGRCLKSPDYYLKNYHFIRQKNLSITTIYPLFDAQQLFLDEFMKQFNLRQAIRIIVLKARQMGITTIGVAIMCWLVFQHPRCHVLSMSDEENKVEMNFSMARTAHAMLPWWMKPEKRYDERPKLLGFDRVKADDRESNPGMDSLMMFEPANKPSGAAYSKSLYGVHLAEIGRYRNPKPITEGVFGSLVGYMHSIGILEGTAQGRHTLFHKLWKAAEAGKFWAPVFMEWFREQGYTMSVPENFMLNREEHAIKKKIKEKCRYDLTDGQLAWRRAKIAEFEAAGDDDRFAQEFPLCVAAETRVSTELGIIKICDAGCASTTESGLIERWGKQPEDKLYLMTTSQGRILRANGRHPVARRDGSFTTMESLAIGDEIVLRPPMFARDKFEQVWHPYPGCESKITIDESWAEFIGYFMGDGSWYRGQIDIACDAKDEDVILRVESIVAEIIGNNYRKNISRVQGRKGCVVIKASCIRALESFCELGIIKRNRDDRYRRNVCVPECIFRSPRIIVRSFLRALFECDGSASNGIVRFGSAKEEFSRDVQLLLLGFGINSSVTMRKKIAGNGASYEFHEVYLGVAASRMFVDEIGFVGNRKNDLVTIIKEKGDGRRPPNTMIDYVSSIISDGIENPYDLTVKNEHVFSANGILTHNTPEEAFVATGLTAFPKKRLHEMSLNFGRQPKWKGEIKLNLNDNRSQTIWPYEDGQFWIWEFPKPGEKYQVGADCALGIDGADYSCAQVYVVPEDISQPIRQVARWRGYMPPTEFARVLCAIGYLYNTAEIAPECNKIDSVASDAAKVIMYPFVYRWIREDKIKNQQSQFVGWLTTARNKNGLIGRMRDALLGWTIIIRCEDDIDEMYDFVESEDGSGIFGARSGCHDDTVMANLITFYTATQLRPRWAIDEDKIEEVFHCNVCEKQYIGATAGDPCNSPDCDGILVAEPKGDYQNTDYSPIYDKEGPESTDPRFGPRFEEL